MVDFRIHLVTVNFCLYCNSERIIKIGQYLPKLCSDEKGPVFFSDSQCVPSYYSVLSIKPNGLSTEQHMAFLPMFGRLASDEVMVQLLKQKCLPSLFCCML